MSEVKIVDWSPKTSSPKPQSFAPIVNKTHQPAPSAPARKECPKINFSVSSGRGKYDDGYPKSDYNENGAQSNCISRSKSIGENCMKKNPRYSNNEFYKQPLQSADDLRSRDTLNVKNNFSVDQQPFNIDNNSNNNNNTRPQNNTRSFNQNRYANKQNNRNNNHPRINNNGGINNGNNGDNNNIIPNNNGKTGNQRQNGICIGGQNRNHVQRSNSKNVTDFRPQKCNNNSHSAKTNNN